MSIVAVPRMFMALGIETIFFIGDGVIAPIVMGFLPLMEAAQAIRTQWQPSVVRPQVVILIADDSDVFRAVPDITVGYTHRHSNAGRDGSRRHYDCRGRHGRWSYDNWRRWRRHHDHGRSREGC